MAELPTDFLSLPLAHRGLHDRAAGRVENAPAAFAAAVAAGYGIELDVQISADGVPIVFHDYVLDRLTDKRGPVKALSAEDLSAIPLAGSGDMIPTLAAVLAHVAGRVPVLIELKDQDGKLGPDCGPLPEAVGAVLAGYAGPVAAMSFNPHMLTGVAAAAPGVATGWVTDVFSARKWLGVPAARRAALAALGGFGLGGESFVSCNRLALDRPPVAALRARGVPVLCWTVRSAAEEAAARRIADNITFEGYLPTIA